MSVGALSQPAPTNPGASLMLVNSMREASGLVRGAAQGPSERVKARHGERQVSETFFLFLHVACNVVLLCALALPL